MNIASVIEPSADTAMTEAAAWLSSFSQSLGRGEGEAVAALFVDDCYWRDLVAFSWTLVTVEGRAQIADMANNVWRAAAGARWMIDGPVDETQGVVSAWFNFENDILRGRGNIRLRDGRCWTLFTTLVELKGFEERRGRRRIKGADHKPQQGAVHWPELRDREQAGFGDTSQPYCLVIGGGQSGIMLAARLRKLDVPTLVIDRHPAPGDTWRSRYKSLYLHDPVWFNHLPGLPFPDDWPVFANAHKMADWIEAYTKVMEVNYWGSTLCRRAVFDEAAQRWTVTVEREGEIVTLHPAHVVMATGLHGTPRIPKIDGAERFLGAQYHAAQSFDPERFAGKTCFVVGANSSGHDIAVTLWENKADVTMIQRSPTIVVRSATLMEQGLGALYSEEAVERGMTVEKADEIAASLPFALLTEFQKPMYEQIRQIDADFYDRLARAGFKYDFGEDGTGITLAALRGRGFYIDVGGSDLIADGKIGLESNGIASFTEDSIILSDGRELPADLVVYATGYAPIAASLAEFLDEDVIARIGRVWGLGSGTPADPGPWEGELRGMWKPLDQPNLWIMGGNFALGRSHSRLLALQIKARMEGVNGAVYKKASVAK